MTVHNLPDPTSNVVPLPVTHSDTTVDERLARLEEQNQRIIEILEKADKAISVIASEVKPTLDALTEHPMLKMFLGSKKDKK